MDAVQEQGWSQFAEPLRIEHHAEFGNRAADGSFGHAYNYIDYFFADYEGDPWHVARAYLDDIDTVFINLNQSELATPHMQDILCFLKLRYAHIMALTGNAGYGRLDAALLAPVQARIDDYLANSEETV